MFAVREQLLVSGVIQLLIGTLCCIFGVFERAVQTSGHDHRRSFHNLTLTSMSYIAVWMGSWIAITGLLGIFTKRTSTFKATIGVYLGFTITSIVFAAVMIIMYFMTVCITYELHSSKKRGVDYHMSILILILSILEFGIGIWASVCCCRVFIGKPQKWTLTVEQVEQLNYMQMQNGSQTVYVIIQGPDGNPVAILNQTGGPMTEQNDIPPHYSAAAATQQDLQTRKTETENRGHSCQTVTYV